MMTVNKADNISNCYNKHSQNRLISTVLSCITSINIKIKLLLYRHTLIILSLLVVFKVSVGQHSLDISISGLDAGDAKITLVSWEKSKEYLFGEDSLILGHASLLIPDSVLPGMISAIFTGNTPINELKVIYTGENISIKLEPSSDFQRLIVSGTGETHLYYSYRQKIDSLVQRIMKLRELLAGFQGDDNFAKKTETFLYKEISAFDSIYSNLEIQYGESMFMHLLNAMRYYFPDTRKGVDEQRQDILVHFFDHFNPFDTMLLHSSVYNSKIEDYLDLATGISVGIKEENLKTAVDRFMEKVIISENLTATVASLMRIWLNKNGFDLTMEYIDIKYLALQCNASNDINLQERLAAYKRLSPGEKAPEIIWTDEISIN